MKLSTRLKKNLWCGYFTGWNGCTKNIAFYVDGKKITDFTTNSLDYADIHHDTITKEMGCKLLPKECPVVNEREIVLHYTSTNYKDWCKK